MPPLGGIYVYLRTYSFVWPVRVLVTLKLPSRLAATLKYAPSGAPLGLAMSGSALLCAASESSALCSIQRSSMPGL